MFVVVLSACDVLRPLFPVISGEKHFPPPRRAFSCRIGGWRGGRRQGKGEGKPAAALATAAGKILSSP